MIATYFDGYGFIVSLRLSETMWPRNEKQTGKIASSGDPSDEWRKIVIIIDVDK